jgi:hypothetical protein
MMGAAFSRRWFFHFNLELDLNLEVFRIRVIQALLGGISDLGFASGWKLLLQGRKENSGNMEVDLLQHQTMH